MGRHLHRYRYPRKCVHPERLKIYVLHNAIDMDAYEFIGCLPAVEVVFGGRSSGGGILGITGVPISVLFSSAKIKLSLGCVGWEESEL